MVVRQTVDASAVLFADHRLPFDNLMNEDCVRFVLVYALLYKLSVRLIEQLVRLTIAFKKPAIIWSSLTCN